MSTLSEVLTDVQALEPIDLPLLDSLGCVLSSSVVAPANVPAFATADVDGFAIRAQDHEPGEVLRVIDEVPAGFRASEPLIPGTCIAVTRGAPLPDEADTIVRASDARVVDGGVMLAAAPMGSGVVGVGELIEVGTPIAAVGRLIDADLIGLLARAGVRSVEVHPRPRVLVVTIGSEFVEPGVPTPTGLVTDHLSFLAAALVAEAGAMVFRVPPVLDDLAEVEAVVDDHAHRSDLIVLCGVDDHALPEITAPLGLAMHESPAGHSVMIGSRQGAIVLGLADEPAALGAQAREILPVVIGRLLGRHET